MYRYTCLITHVQCYITILTGLKSNDQLHTNTNLLSISLIRKFCSYIVVNKLWLALEWYIPMLWLALHMFDVALHVFDVALHVLDVVLVST